MSETALIGLPLLESAQAQKHVTHNEALLLIDGALQLAVASRTLAAPPGSPTEGARYLVPAGASGDWAGHEGDVALYAAQAWRFLTPAVGWRMWVAAESLFLLHDGTGWRDLQDIDALSDMAHLGINATADGWNRLIVRSSGSLFTHESGDHRMTLNKEAAGNTGSLLFQTGYSGRAEMGLAGDDDFRIKVSADGGSWFEALQIDGASGVVTFPAGARPNLMHVAAALSSDVALATANQFFDGPSLALDAGTWLVSFHASYASSAALAAIVTARISDGTTHHASQAASHPAAVGEALGLAMTAMVTLAGSTTLKGQMAASVVAGAMKATAPANASGANATMLSALRIS
jgi:hypothetical protein